jgi:hypothetical protein
MFRIFDNGYWDKSQWREIPKGFSIPERAQFGFVVGGKFPTPEEALQQVLPLLEKEPLGPILKDLGKSAQG